MHINNLPSEILFVILDEARKANEREGVTWTFGLSHTDATAAGPLFERLKPSRHVRGPCRPDTLRWELTSALRQVCHRWHDWALTYALRDIYVQRSVGSERWAELPLKRDLYNAYELIERPSGFAVYRDQLRGLQWTADFLSTYPLATDQIRRMWFGGFYTPEAESLIFAVMRSCRRLSSISVPWTMLRHGTGQEWMHLLGIATADDIPVKSLELQAVCLPHVTTDDSRVACDLKPLLDSRLDFSRLERLKLFGNTTFLPIDDTDLLSIAKTATRLIEFHVTCMSTVSIRGVVAVVKASRSTLEVLDYSPRAKDGFLHPDPGSLDESEHVCDILQSCPRLRDLSISVPRMCSRLFQHHDVQWTGECQVRAIDLCQHLAVDKAGAAHDDKNMRLKALLDDARSLISSQRRRRRDLDIQIFFADCIFEPNEFVVHGDFALAQINAFGGWPHASAPSSKGPYGSTGLYGKDDGDWDIIGEQEYARALDAGWLSV